MNATCSGCGYRLVGLGPAIARCPECGKLIPRSRRSRERELAADVARAAWREPVPWIIGGLVVSSIALGAAHGGELMAGYLIVYPILVLILFLTYLLCCAIWIGFDEPLRLVALRLAAVQAMTDATYLVVGIQPIRFVAWLVSCIVFIGMLMKLFEIDLSDAWLVGLVLFAVKVALTIVLAAVVLAYAAPA